MLVVNPLVEVVKTAGASVAFPSRGSAGAPDGILVYGSTAEVRRAAAALGFSCDKRSDVVTHLRGEDGFVATMSTDVAAQRSCFQLTEDSYQRALATANEVEGRITAWVADVVLFERSRLPFGHPRRLRRGDGPANLVRRATVARSRLRAHGRYDEKRILALAEGAEL